MRFRLKQSTVLSRTAWMSFLEYILKDVFTSYLRSKTFGIRHHTTTQITLFSVSENVMTTSWTSSVAFAIAALISS
eukprot:TRINITY_DN7786_c0_g1_i1.p1 TRINITY_DN7786_c0_g1~~TRINITY_DN7786_c0_g1_i1.p1  ORF type:complete len:76 (+),score=3.32 TRINITY_DN7786_c0_g1_i1:271-498(+)